MLSSIKQAGKDLLRRAGWRLIAYSEGEPGNSSWARVNSVEELRLASLAYAKSMRLREGGSFSGYRYCSTSKKPVLYATIAALLLKHLLDAIDEDCTEELEYLTCFQNDDGLFRDPVISCPQADQEDWWGWRHMTMLALMALALYRKPAPRSLKSLEPLFNENAFRRYLDSWDWGVRAAWTSNTLQNVGVMMQYARDYQGVTSAARTLEILFDYLDEKQDPATGLFGDKFESAEELSNGVQAGYHFWLLNFYDGRPIRHVESIIDSVLRTQSLSGGFGVKWNSSACEDIDSIDPLVRLTRLTSHKADAVQAAFQRALPALVRNANSDGGWVFRRDEAMTYGFSEHMYSAANQSNLFFTWFRMLNHALLLEGMTDNRDHKMKSRWDTAPGLQFLHSHAI